MGRKRIGTERVNLAGLVARVSLVPINERCYPDCKKGSGRMRVRESAR